MFSISKPIDVPVVRPSNTPDNMRTASGSLRCVVNLLCPGLRASRKGWMSSSDSVSPGGHPSTTAPIAGPWLSPQVVKRKIRPKVFQLMHCLMPATVGACPFSLDQNLLEAQEQTMIAKLKGLLDETGADWAVIDVGGVGYLVHCSSKTLAALGERGEACTVYTDLQVSETDMRLLGFAEGAERDWFRLLTQVQGVGSKVALAILSALSTGEVQAACAKGDAAMVARANGVGPKLAGRIVNELKDKAGALPGGGDMGVGVAVAAAGGASADAVSALENLGFKPAVAARAVAAAQGELGENAGEGDLIRVALKRAAG